MIDAKALGLELAAMVKAQFAPIKARLDAIETRLDNLPAPVDLSAEFAALKSAVDDLAFPEVPELPDIASLVAQSVTEAVAAIPAPQNGKSVTAEEIAPLIASEVEKRISELPCPKDGKDGAPGKDGPPGRDGLDVKEMLRAEGGRLVAVMSDGTTRDLGIFVGKDGAPGKDGNDGADGFGFDDLEAIYDGEKTIILRFAQGDRVKEFAYSMPVVIDRGVYKTGEAYRAGDGVTFGGSFWIAQKDTSAKPEGSDDWRLAVKRGRDGKDGGTKEAKAFAPLRLGGGEARNG